MNLVKHGKTGNNYVVLQEGDTDKTIESLNVNLHFDDAGVLIGIEILETPSGSYAEGRRDAAKEIEEFDVLSNIPGNVNALQALSYLQKRLSDIAKGSE
jgi:hypothetical protein